MFGRKKRGQERIELLEARLEDLEGIVDLLCRQQAVMMFETDIFTSLMQENGASPDEVETMARMKEDYERKLKRLVRTMRNGMYKDPKKAN